MSTRCWDYISKNRADFGVQRICRVLEASRANYYRHLATRPVPSARPRRSGP
ncbi:hypothetical protein EES46_19790 [Streptomyces sp. ADI98-10]|nr:hypothetical protein EES46_19790 [Streptomyces sp. ADI98-10]